MNKKGDEMLYVDLGSPLEWQTLATRQLSLAHVTTHFTASIILLFRTPPSFQKKIVHEVIIIITFTDQKCIYGIQWNHYLRTPLYYGQFTWSLRDRNTYNPYTDTSTIYISYSMVLHIIRADILRVA